MVAPPDQTDRSTSADALVSQAVRGDVAALGRLEQRLTPVMRTRARVFLARQHGHKVADESVEDLCQLVWVELMRNAWAALKAFDPNRGATLETYVGAIADKECLRLRRDLSAQKRAAGVVVPFDEMQDHTTSSVGDPEKRLAHRELADGLLAHLRELLPARGQVVLALLHEDELSVSDAAAFMGVQPQVIYNWQHQIRTLARQYLEVSRGERP